MIRKWLQFISQIVSFDTFQVNLTSKAIYRHAKYSKSVATQPSFFEALLNGRNNSIRGEDSSGLCAVSTAVIATAAPANSHMKYILWVYSKRSILWTVKIYLKWKVLFDVNSIILTFILPVSKYTIHKYIWYCVILSVKILHNYNKDRLFFRCLDGFKYYKKCKL